MGSFGGYCDEATAVGGAGAGDGVLAGDGAVVKLSRPGGFGFYNVGFREYS